MTVIMFVLLIGLIFDRRLFIGLSGLALLYSLLFLTPSMVPRRFIAQQPHTKKSPTMERAAAFQQYHCQRQFYRKLYLLLSFTIFLYLSHFRVWRPPPAYVQQKRSLLYFASQSLMQIVCEGDQVFETVRKYFQCYSRQRP